MPIYSVVCCLVLIFATSACLSLCVCLYLCGVRSSLRTCRARGQLTRVGSLLPSCSSWGCIVRLGTSTGPIVWFKKKWMKNKVKLLIFLVSCGTVLSLQLEFCRPFPAPPPKIISRHWHNSNSDSEVPGGLACGWVLREGSLTPTIKSKCRCFLALFCTVYFLPLECSSWDGASLGGAS